MAREGDGPTVSRAAVRIAAVVVALIVSGYCILVVTGVVPPEDRLGVAEFVALGLVLAVLALSFAPGGIFTELSRLKLGAFEVEIREKVATLEQNQTLLFRLVPLLIPTHERAHLQKLASGEDADYVLSPGLPAEIRSLRGKGLVQNRGQQRVSELPAGTGFRLSDHVLLTDLGREWLAILQQAQEAGLPIDAPAYPGQEPLGPR